jgi:hypothetical protein
VVYHHTPASFVSSSIKTDRSIEVKYSSKVKKEIDDPSKIYLIVGSEKIPLSSYTPSGENSFLLTFPRSFSTSGNIVIAGGLVDYYGSSISEDTIRFSYTPQPGEQQFYIENFTILDNYTVTVTFNLEVDMATASLTNNYHFSPDNNVTSVTAGSNSRTVILSLKGAKPIGALGREYTLTIKNLRSSIKSGSVAINQNAGATIVLTATTANLDDIFVYPSPVDRSKHGSVTFANLPRNVDIIVFNLEGRRIAEFKESDGNGGVTWNLTDSDGREVPTGVYIYRAAMTDGKGEELSTKLGKIAIIR